MENTTPRVFVSYSHDSPEHTKWVSDFATKLLDNGVDVILDQWDLRYGDDVPKFMEKGVSEADRVLMVCTLPYVRKSNEGKGGVGYEAMIVTGELVRDLGTSKFIPIVKQDSEPAELPVSVSTRFYINLSHADKFDAEFVNLLRELHGAPAVTKPPLGKRPKLEANQEETKAKAKSKSSKPVSSASLRPITKMVEASSDSFRPENYYDTAFNIARTGDMVEWRRLVRHAREKVNDAIQEWRKQYEHSLPNTWQKVLPIAVEGAATYAPLMAIALAGVESGESKFNNQRAILDDILYPRNWNQGGRTLIVEFPTSLVFVYQALHGAACLATEQLGAALKLVSAPIEFPTLREHIPFWKHHGAMGWPEAFEGKATTAWSTIGDLSASWKWLDSIFGDADEYKSALCAYYMALNVFEYADTLAAEDEKSLNSRRIQLEIPLCFESENNDVKRRGYRLLTQDPEAVKQIWRNRGIDDQVARDHWQRWIEICEGWIAHVYEYQFRHGAITHRSLFDELYM